MNNQQRLEDLAAFVVAEARRLGATDCDVSISGDEGISVDVRNGEVEKLEGAQGRGLSFRAFVGKNSASSSSSDFRRRSLTKLVRETIALAKASEPDKDAGLPDRRFMAKSVPDLKLYDAAVMKLTAEDCIERAIALEKAALGKDKRLSTDGASCSRSAAAVVYANSLGFVGSYINTGCSLSVSLVAKQGDGSMQTDGWWSQALQLDKLESVEEVATEAAQRTLRRLGACRVKSQSVPVIFDRRMAAGLLGQLAGAASGDSIYRRSSFLLGKLGAQIACPQLTIIDDAHIKGGIGSSPFGDEGLPTGRREVVKDGKLGCYFVNGYAGRKLDMDPNGGGPTNLYIQNGTVSPEDMIASVKNGLYLTSVSGPGYNPVTGDYSRGASGIWIEDGKLAYPVEGITVASNLLTMLQSIEMIGNDLEFRSSVNSPTLKIASMMVAGEG